MVVVGLGGLTTEPEDMVGALGEFHHPFGLRFRTCSGSV